MQALTNAATAPSTAASGVFTNCATETTPKKVVQIAHIKPTNAAVLDIKELSILLFIWCTIIHVAQINNKEIGIANIFFMIFFSFCFLSGKKNRSYM